MRDILLLHRCAVKGLSIDTLARAMNASKRLKLLLKVTEMKIDSLPYDKKM